LQDISAEGISILLAAPGYSRQVDLHLYKSEPAEAGNIFLTVFCFYHWKTVMTTFAPIEAQHSLTIRDRAW
jgi:hypothetical protein